MHISSSSIICGIVGLLLSSSAAAQVPTTASDSIAFSASITSLTIANRDGSVRVVPIAFRAEEVGPTWVDSIHIMKLIAPVIHVREGDTAMSIASTIRLRIDLSAATFKASTEPLPDNGRRSTFLALAHSQFVITDLAHPGTFPRLDIHEMVVRTDRPRRDTSSSNSFTIRLDGMSAAIKLSVNYYGYGFKRGLVGSRGSLRIAHDGIHLAAPYVVPLVVNGKQVKPQNLK